MTRECFVSERTVRVSLRTKIHRSFNRNSREGLILLLSSPLSSGLPEAPFFGVTVVRAAFVLAFFGWGVGFYGPPIFLHAVVTRTGWSLTLVSAAVTFHFLLGAAVVAMLPRIHQQCGIPVTTIAGALCLALGLLGWSVAQSPPALFVAAALTGAGWVTMGAAAVNAIVSPWYSRTRPMALAKAYNGGSVGGIVFSSLLVLMIAKLGFVTAAGAIGAIMIVVVTVLALKVLSKTPDQMGQVADDGLTPHLAASHAEGPRVVQSLWIDWRFQTLAAAMTLGLFAQIGLIAHLYGLLVQPFGVQAAGAFMTLATAWAIVGRTMVGKWMPVGADRRRIAAMSYTVQLMGSIVLLTAGVQNTAVTVLAVSLFGVGLGNTTTLPPLIAHPEFSKSQVPRVVALIVALSQAFYAFAPALFGVVLTISAPRDAPAVSTSAFFATVALLQLLAIGCLLLGRQRSTAFSYRP